MRHCSVGAISLHRRKLSFKKLPSEAGLMLYVLGPETCSKRRHSKLLQKAVCPDLFATLPNVFAVESLIMFANNC
jgi:hypothetical protein